MYKEVSQKWNENIFKNVQAVMNVYFDGVLINPNYITDFKLGNILFDGELKLGATPRQYIDIQIHKKAGIKIPKIIKIDYGILINKALTVKEVNAMTVGDLNGIKVKSLSKDDSSFEMIPMGIYNVDDYDDEDDNVINIKALDNMINLDLNDGYYDASEIINAKGYATLGELASDICIKKGLELGSSSFLNSDKKITVYDNAITATEYMSMIAESAGGFCCAGRDGKIYIKTIGEDKVSIPLKLFKNYKFNEEYKISKVAYEDGVRDYKFGDEERNTLWISQDNMFIVDEDQIKKIYNNIKNLTINGFEGTSIINPAWDMGDIILIDDKPIIYQGEMTLNGRFISDIKSKISIKQREETTVKKQSQKAINREIYSEIDQQNLKINQVIKETTDNTEKLTQHEQTLDSITDTVSKVENKLENDYYTKEETNSQITQKADIITSEVNKSISTAKQEAINSANSSTDSKLRNYSTTTEMNSKITQTAEEINTEVRKKIGEDEVCSIISQSADKITIKSNRISIQSDYFTLDENGNITATGGTIGGFILGSTEFTGNLDGIYNYNEYDMRIATNSFMGNFSDLDLGILKEILDISGDGNITSADAVRMIRIMNGSQENTKRVSGDIKINSKDPKNALCITKDGELCVSLGVGGINTNSLSAKTIVCGNIDKNGDSYNFNGISLSSSTIALTYGLNGSMRQCVTLSKDKFRMNDDGNWIEISLNKGITIRRLENDYPAITVTDGNELNTLQIGATYISSPEFLAKNEESTTYIRPNNIETPKIILSGSNSEVLSSGIDTNYIGTGSEYYGITTSLRGNTVRLYAHSGGGVYLGYSGSTAVTSDETQKDIYEIDDRYIDFFNKIKPITYIYKKRGHRNHIGFGARQIETALKEAGLTTEQFAGVLKDKDVTISADEMGTEEDIHFDELYSLRYEEFIALNTLMIQKLQKRIETLENEKKEQ